MWQFRSETESIATETAHGAQWLSVITALWLWSQFLFVTSCHHLSPLTKRLMPRQRLPFVQTFR
jgi:hypothetical protein